MDKFTQEEHLPQPLQTDKQKFKRAVAFLTVYNGIFNVKNKSNKLYSTVSINNDEFTQITFPTGA